jgi:hypothetical protein
MKTFDLGQRVFVEKDAYGGAIGITGTVRRLRQSDHGAWVALDQRHDLCPFPPTDLTRSTHVMTYPEHCTPAAATAEDSP